MRGRKLMRGSLLNSVNLLAQIASGLYLMPLMIRAFGNANYGIWILIASFLGYASILDMGLPTAVTRFVSQALGKNDDGEEIEKLTSTAFYIFTSFALMAGLFYFGVYFFTPSFLKTADEIRLFRALLVILCWNTLITFPAFIFEGVLMAHLRHDLVNLTKISGTVIRVLLSILLIHYHYNLISIAYMTLGTNILENLLRVSLGYSVEKRIKISWQYFSILKIRLLFGYSIYTFIAKIADLFRFQISSFVITIFLGVAQVTVYRVASRLTEYFIQFIGGLTGVLSPYFSQEEGKKNFAGINEKFLFATKLTTYISAFTGGMLIILGYDFISRWVGPQYTDAFHLLVVLTIPLILALSQAATFPLFYGISKHKFVAYTNIIEGILNLSLSLLLVKKYGLLGIALGVALPMMLTKLFIQPVYVTRVLRIRLWSYFSAIFRPLVISCVILFGCNSLFRGFLRPDYLILSGYSVIQLGIFFSLIYIWGFSLEEKKFLEKILSFKRFISI